MSKVRGAPNSLGVPVRKITQQLKKIQRKRGLGALPGWGRYGLALLVTGVVLGLGLLLLRLVPGMEAPVLLFAFGVLLSARFLGLGPGLAATLLGTLAFDYAFWGVGRLRPESVAEQIHTALLLGVGVFCCFLMQEMHRTRQRADDDAQALEEGERFLQNLVRNLPGAAYRCRNNQERVLDYISEGILALSGYRPTELIESRVLSFTHLIHPEDRAWVFREIQCALKEERPYHFVYRIKTAFGREKWAWEKGQGVYSPEGVLLALEGFLIDVTERKQAEEKQGMLLAQEQALAIENARLYQEAKNTIQMRDEFLSIASHELKTPLTPMRLKLQSLLRLCQKSTEAELTLRQITPKLEITVRQVDRLHRLIEELLDISRISVGKLELTPEPVDLAALLKEVLERFSEELRSANCPLKLEGPEELWGLWDKLRLEQILSNLLSNAIKYGAGQAIEITLFADESRVWLRIRDHGIGIERGDQERIFQRFERAVSERHYGGFGLGLWITRQIAEAAGGSISVYSRPKEGALFTLELPREKGAL